MSVVELHGTIYMFFVCIYSPKSSSGKQLSDGNRIKIMWGRHEAPLHFHQSTQFSHLIGQGDQLPWEAWHCMAWVITDRENETLRFSWGMDLERGVDESVNRYKKSRRIALFQLKEKYKNIYRGEKVWSWIPSVSETHPFQGQDWYK